MQSSGPKEEDDNDQEASRPRDEEEHLDNQKDGNDAVLKAPSAEAEREKAEETGQEEEKHIQEGSESQENDQAKAPDGNDGSEQQHQQADNRDVAARLSPQEVCMGDNQWVSLRSFAQGVLQQYQAHSTVTNVTETSSSGGGGSRGSSAATKKRSGGRQVVGPAAMSSSDNPSKKTKKGKRVGFVTKPKQKYNPEADLKAKPGETKEERRRRMNRITGRRKRAKVVIEIDGLIEQCHEFTSWNQALKGENSKLKESIVRVKELMDDKKMPADEQPGAREEAAATRIRPENVPTAEELQAAVALLEQQLQPRQPDVQQNTEQLLPGNTPASLQPQEPATQGQQAQPTNSQIQQFQQSYQAALGAIQQLMPQSAPPPPPTLTPQQLQQQILQQALQQALQSIFASAGATNPAQPAMAALPIVGILSSVISAAQGGTAAPLAAPPNPNLPAGPLNPNLAMAMAQYLIQAAGQRPQIQQPQQQAQQVPEPQQVHQQQPSIPPLSQAQFPSQQQAAQQPQQLWIGQQPQQALPVQHPQPQMPLFFPPQQQPQILPPAQQTMQPNLMSQQLQQLPGALQAQQQLQPQQFAPPVLAASPMQQQPLQQVQPANQPVPQPQQQQQVNPQMLFASMMQFVQQQQQQQPQPPGGGTQGRGQPPGSTPPPSTS